MGRRYLVCEKCGKMMDITTLEDHLRGLPLDTYEHQGMCPQCLYEKLYGKAKLYYVGDDKSGT